jgi:hypothetical protein
MKHLRYLILESNDINTFNPKFAPDMAGELKTKNDIDRFIFAGKAIFTIRNNDTGNRFTYRLMKVEDADVFFVSVLTGSDNNTSYSFFGTIFDKTRFSLSKNKSRLDINDPKHMMAIKTFQWFFDTLISITKPFPSQVQIWHEGVCGTCGKKLTVPESIDIGLGPICAKKADLWERSKRLVDINNKTGLFN